MTPAQTASFEKFCQDRGDATLRAVLSDRAGPLCWFWVGQAKWPGPGLWGSWIEARSIAEARLFAGHERGAISRCEPELCARLAQGDGQGWGLRSRFECVERLLEGVYYRVPPSVGGFRLKAKWQGVYHRMTEARNNAYFMTRWFDSPAARLSDPGSVDALKARFAKSESTFAKLSRCERGLRTALLNLALPPA